MTQPPPPPSEPSLGSPSPGPVEAAWFYMYNSQRLGPLSTQALLSMAQSRSIAPGTMVWRDGMPTWAPIAGTPEFAFVFRPSSGVTISTPPEGILGLTTNGFILFIVLLLVCIPMCWLPWVIKDLRVS